MSSTRSKQRTSVTDVQRWILVNAASTVPDGDLADALGITVSAVHHARWLLRQQPWTCTVAYVPCRHCEATLTRRTHKHAYHDACRPGARKAIQRRLDDARPIRPDALERAHQWSRETRAQSLLTAINGGHNSIDGRRPSSTVCATHGTKRTC